MEVSGILGCDVRVKEEPCDLLLIENDREMIDEKSDLKNFQPLSILQKISTHELGKCELDDEVEIVVECEDFKPNMDSLVARENDDYFPNNLWNTKDSNSCNSHNIIKVESAREVKKEFVYGDAEGSNLNINCELFVQNKNRGITEKLNKKHNLKIPVYTVYTDSIHRCDTCGNTYTKKSSLKFHNDSVHNGVKHACDICQKKMSTKRYLKLHINSVHYNMTHGCHICGKKYSEKYYLKKHIESIHYGIRHACDICGKSFFHKRTLKTHIDSMHNGITHGCDICGKTFSQKGRVKTHIDSVHNKITHACNTCGKSFTLRSNLKRHIDSIHAGVMFTS